MLLFYLAVLSTPEERQKLSFFYEKFKRRLISTALSFTHNQAMAEDAVHNTFISAINHRDKLSSMTEKDFLKWSVIVVKRKCIDILRKDKRYSSTPIEDMGEFMSADTIPVDEYVIQQDTYKRLKGHIAELDDTSRQILVMKYDLQMSMNEIADVLGFTTTQVNSRIARARAKVRTKMGNEALNFA